MSFPRPMKLSTAALALVAPLALVACSSGESEDDAAPSTSAVTSTVEATSEEETTSAETTTEETTTSEAAETTSEEEADTQAQAAPEEPAAQNGGAAAEAGAPAADAAAGNPLATEELQPVQGGQAADEATSGQISALVNGWYEVPDMRAYMRYIPDNTCSQVLAQNPEVNNVDYSMFPQVPMSQVSEDWNSAGVQSIDDLVVNGADASATVTVNTGEGVDTSVMRFKNEGGSWLFCN